MNGCCYGGECHLEKGCVQFPKYSSVEQQVLSPPYRHQLATGRLHGFVMSANQAGQPLVRSVDPRSAAEDGGLTAGVRIAEINGIATEKIDVAEEVLLHSGPDISITLADGQRLKWTIGAMPPQSRPVHPSQFYAAISGFLILFVLLTIEPFFDRRGALMATLLTLYPVVRFLEEIIRDDEPTQWGTALTISQLISVVVLLGGLVTWYFVFRKEIGERRAPAKTAAA
jgi:phosphatidylglycerol:prolipoprotein diacylglycerol transferase